MPSIIPPPPPELKLKSARNGWHRGELAMHEKRNFTGPMIDTLYKYIETALPEDHRAHHTKGVLFTPMASLDKLGRPWVSILAGRDGQRGFIRSPSDTSLIFKAKAWDGDPILQHMHLFVNGQNKMLIAGIGIDYTDRRRTKFAGHISRLDRDDQDLEIEVTIEQAINNCPKYICLRDLVPKLDTSPKISHQNHMLSAEDRLPDQVISFILKSDSLFLGTLYVATAEDEEVYPSHMGLNHRGGRPGFTRVIPSDGRTVVVPDYSGDRIMASLGNIEATPVAGLTFISYTSGDVLYLTGEAKTLVGKESRDIMPLQNAVTTVYVTGYTLVLDAIPVRQRSDTTSEPSPYSPPIQLLAEESINATLYDTADTEVMASLTSVQVHSPSMATFTWDLSEDVKIKPGQAVIMDFSAPVGDTVYRHLDADDPTGLNDARIRTWTVSSSHPGSGTRSLSVTVREKIGGVITGYLFNLIRKQHDQQDVGQIPRIKTDATPLDLRVRVMGISGEFVLPVPGPVETAGARAKMLWVAGGVGVTPFLSMLSAISSSPDKQKWDVKLVLSTQEPDGLLPVILQAAQGATEARRLTLSIDVLSHVCIPDIDAGDVVILKHKGRLPSSFFADSVDDIEERDVYMCGPTSFEEAAHAALINAGVESGQIKREKFTY